MPHERRGRLSGSLSHPQARDFCCDSLPLHQTRTSQGTELSWRSRWPNTWAPKASACHSNTDIFLRATRAGHLPRIGPLVLVVFSVMIYSAPRSLLHLIARGRRPESMAKSHAASAAVERLQAPASASEQLDRPTALVIMSIQFHFGSGANLFTDDFSCALFFSLGGGKEICVDVFPCFFFLWASSCVRFWAAGLGSRNTPPVCRNGTGNRLMRFSSPSPEFQVACRGWALRLNSRQLPSCRTCIGGSQLDLFATEYIPETFEEF